MSHPVIDHKGLKLHDKMLFEKAIINPPMAFPQPMPNEACFIYVLNGGLNAVSENSIESVKEREAVLMKCGTFIGQMIPSETSEVYEAVAVHFYPEILKKVYGNEIPNILKEPLPDPSQLAKVPSDDIMARYIESIMFYFENPALATEEMLALKLKELIILLTNTSNAPIVRSILSNLFTPVSITLRELIESHKYNDISVSELAQLANMSLSTFKREFNKIYSESPASYLRNAKLAKAADLIRVSDENISHIAWDCGFQDISHFSRAFKSKFGVSPSEYRMSHMAK